MDTKLFYKTHWHDILWSQWQYALQKPFNWLYKTSSQLKDIKVCILIHAICNRGTTNKYMHGYIIIYLSSRCRWLCNDQVIAFSTEEFFFFLVMDQIKRNSFFVLMLYLRSRKGTVWSKKKIVTASLISIYQYVYNRAKEASPFVSSQSTKNEP